MRKPRDFDAERYAAEASALEPAAREMTFAEKW